MRRFVRKSLLLSYSHVILRMTTSHRLKIAELVHSISFAYLSIIMYGIIKTAGIATQRFSVRALSLNQPMNYEYKRDIAIYICGVLYPITSLFRDGKRCTQPRQALVFHCLPERARYDDVSNRVSDVVKSCPIRIYHRLLRHSPDYLATRCKPVRNRLGEFIGHSCVGLWGKQQRGYIRLPRCVEERDIGNYSQASLPAIPLERAERTSRRAPRTGEQI